MALVASSPSGLDRAAETALYAATVDGSESSRAALRFLSVFGLVRDSPRISLRSPDDPHRHNLFDAGNAF
jgi:hypothetical protein